jgi:hypothetical protein
MPNKEKEKKNHKTIPNEPNASMQMLAEPSLSPARHGTVVSFHSLSEVNTASSALDAGSANRGPANVLNGADRESLLVVVDGLDDAADGSAFHGDGDDGLALDAKDVEAVARPVEAGVGEDNAEADEGDHVGDAGVDGVGDGGLDWGEDGAAGDTHDEDTGTAAGVGTEVGSSECEEGRVHGSHEEEDNNEHGNTCNTVDRADGGDAANGADGVDDEEEVGLED